MKKLATRLLVLLGCALPVVLATGTGLAGADPLTIAVGASVNDNSIAVNVDDEAVIVTAGPTTLDMPMPECAYDADCVKVQPNFCLAAGPKSEMGVEACTAIGD